MIYRAIWISRWRQDTALARKFGARRSHHPTLQENVMQTDCSTFLLYGLDIHYFYFCHGLFPDSYSVMNRNLSLMSTLSIYLFVIMLNLSCSLDKSFPIPAFISPVYYRIWYHFSLHFASQINEVPSLSFWRKSQFITLRISFSLSIFIWCETLHPRWVATYIMYLGDSRSCDFWKTSLAQSKSTFSFLTAGERGSMSSF